MPSAHRSGDLAYLAAGDPSQPPLVLLHGLSDSAACWADAFERWGRQYHVIAWDARGHGGSARFTDEQLAAGVGETHLADAVVLLETLAAQGIERPILVGHSMGGGTAAAVAATRADLVRAAVLEDPALGAGFRDGAEADEAAATRVAEAEQAAGDPAAALADLRADNPAWPERELVPCVESTIAADRRVLGDARITVRTPWEEVAAAIAVPALVVTGDHDVIWSGDLLARLRAVDNARLEVAAVAGADHCVRRARTDAFHALVDPWLARQDAVRSARGPAERSARSSAGGSAEH